MPSHYLYVCGNGHEEMRYRNSSRCRKCGLPILRKDAPLPDKELQSLRAQNAALLAENERLQRERSEWCDQADRRLTEQMTQQRDLLAEVERLRARLTLTPEKVEAAAKAVHGRWALFYDEDVPWEDENKAVQKLYRSSQRAALLAAGMEEAEQ